MDRAVEIFVVMPVMDALAWTGMILVSAINGRCEEAFMFFEEMHPWAEAQFMVKKDFVGAMCMEP